MGEKRGFDFLDYLVILTKWKKFLIILSFAVMVVSYLSIYFFIDEQFDSRALIVAAEDEQAGMISSLMKSFSDLPVSIPGISPTSDTDLFTTIIYSRSNLEKVINKFGLFDEYGHDTMAETVEELEDKIEADETKEGAYEIIVRASSPQKSADMVNYIIENLNETVLELEVQKSKDNRIFLEERYFEIRKNLKAAEDSLVIYQDESGILHAEDQAKASIDIYSKLEAELAVKEVELAVLKRIYGKDYPQTVSTQIAYNEYKEKLEKIKAGKDTVGLILSLNKLPERTMVYLRHFRDVEIYSKMLEFMIPLYEQSRFQEQKDIPVIQVIDKGVPAEKKDYPPRILFSLLFTFIIMSIVLFIIITREVINNSENPKVKYIMRNLYFGKSNSEIK
ncbi:GumC family protein [Bacteroidota bacterium]